MPSYTILTDSSCNLTEELIDAHELEILSLRFMNEGNEYTSYLKGETTDLGMFYRMMREGKVFTTSLPNQQASSDIIRSILDRGQDILYVGFSSGLSGTYEATVNLLDNMRSEYPERKIYTCDTRGASLGQGLLVLYAADMREAGKSIEDTHAWLEEHRFHLAHWFTVDDLMYLYRGGRVSRTSATAANILSIKPVLHMDNPGHLIPREKVRSRKRSIKALFNHMVESYDSSYGPQHIAISHGDCLEDALELKAMIEAEPSFDIRDFTINYVDPVIGSHSGPGTLALFFLAGSRG
ncbi:DegV family protein [Denitrobacterium detoxificans]|jgi:DegV family protein with EDD domain|uniref:DegV family protein n=1 Tax=Denitrobacterium detoxificans TaxID=79604 RepID=UPI0026F21617|nr:DegV family protein [Denitrobacterium detoxificans]MBE6465988.1 DegV family protein [Denitrobacterium detoxificans]